MTAVQASLGFAQNTYLPIGPLTNMLSIWNPKDYPYLTFHFYIYHFLLKLIWNPSEKFPIRSLLFFSKRSKRSKRTLKNSEEQPCYRQFNKNLILNLSNYYVLPTNLIEKKLELKSHHFFFLSVVRNISIHMMKMLFICYLLLSCQTDIPIYKNICRQSEKKTADNVAKCNCKRGWKTI